MRKAILVYGTLVLGIAGIGYAAAQVAHQHDNKGDTQGPPAAASAGSAVPGHHPGMGHDGMPMGYEMGMPNHEMGMPNHEMGMGPFAALHGAMQRPLTRSLFGAFLLPEMQTELGLSSDQVGQLNQARQELLAKGDGFARQIAAKQKELDALFTPDTSKGQQVKTLLEQIAELRAQEHYAIYITARKMKAVLGEDQRNRLEALKPEELHHAAMSHLTLGDLARAMQFLDAGL